MPELFRGSVVPIAIHSLPPSLRFLLHLLRLPGMDPYPSTGPVSSSPRDRESHQKGPSRMYALQVRAFIEAAEVVDADPDTIEDILDGFDEDVLVDDDQTDAQDAIVDTDGEADHVGEQDDVEDDEFEKYLEEGMVPPNACCGHLSTYLVLSRRFSGDGLDEGTSEIHDE